MPFDLTKAAGYDKFVSNLDTNQEVVKISLDKLVDSEKNFFRVEDVQDLMESIQLVGLLDPLVVVPFGDEYRIIAGHRRKKALAELAKSDKQYAAAPCIILPEMSKDMEMVTLIQSNTTARELSSYEKAEAAQRLKKHLVELKKQGVKIPGRLRDIVAEQMQISATEVARMEVINKNLSDDWKPFWKENKINAYCAYEIAKMPPADQAELFQRPRDPRLSRMDANTIERFNLEQKCKNWMETNCPHPLGWSDTEAARRGEAVPCSNLEKILAHRVDAWSHKKKDSCPGCCGKCKNAAVCKEACDNASSIAKHCEAERTRKEEEAKKQQEQIAQNAMEQSPSEASFDAAHAAFMESFLSNIGPNLFNEMKMKGISSYEGSLLWSEEFGKLIGDHDFDDYKVSDIENILDASDALDLDYMLPEFLALCLAVGTTPDRLLGLREDAAPSGWHDFKTKKPADGQRVVAMRETGGGARFYSEYIYKQENGIETWYFSEIPDTQASISNVVAWTEAPEEFTNGS